uniref:Leucine-rich repeat-containing protein 59 n=1 Tax=Caenorhabditis tropicalis TaxID=1561998 RepID=A0A1I7U4D5_9PELO
MSSENFNYNELQRLQEGDELDLSSRGISEYPMGITHLARLKKLDLSHNWLSSLPDKFANRLQLTRLDLGHNLLRNLPDSIGLLTSLQHLSLHDNNLEDLPVNFSNLKALKYLDLKNNPLNQQLKGYVGNCGTAAECKTAAKRVMTEYMEMKTKEAKEAQRAKEYEDIRVHQEKHAAKAAKQKKKDDWEKTANREREAAAAAAAKAMKVAAAAKVEKKENREEEKKKAAPPRRGIFRTLFSLTFSAFFYITLIFAASATVAIGLDCRGLGSKVPGNQPLCKDFQLIGSGQKPSDKFFKNAANSYTSILKGYHAQAEPHVAPAKKWFNTQWRQFVKTDIGKKVEQKLYQIHAFIVDLWVKVQRFVTNQWNAVVAWWKKDGEKQFGPALDGFLIGLKMVYNVVADVARNIVRLVVHFAHRVEKFFVAFSEGGFQKAMNTLNQ